MLAFSSRASARWSARGTRRRGEARWPALELVSSECARWRHGQVSPGPVCTGPTVISRIIPDIRRFSSIRRFLSLTLGGRTPTWLRDDQLTGTRRTTTLVATGRSRRGRRRALRRPREKGDPLSASHHLRKRKGQRHDALCDLGSRLPALPEQPLLHNPVHSTKVEVEQIRIIVETLPKESLES
jgi:hypothetical protein